MTQGRLFARSFLFSLSFVTEFGNELSLQKTSAHRSFSFHGRLPHTMARARIHTDTKDDISKKNANKKKRGHKIISDGLPNTPSSRNSRYTRDSRFLKFAKDSIKCKRIIKEKKQDAIKELQCSHITISFSRSGAVPGGTLVRRS